jgi:CHAT domain-containing protein
MFSSLQLAGGPLTVFDVYNVDIGAELVTLSGCETGVNLVADGDELIGLSRAFLHAGAQSLLLSLWAVHDRSTAALMEVFYETLKRGERPRRALRAAQLSVLHQEGHPFYWAPFFVCGRG